ncbi:MAG TPA: septal ring lytic transglycosylase RlpA family protein [Thermoanaerobaculia bacterium]|nr:septal ring lytic transglycosylase RlpA family protein [Thermoanaerobaculia bacterium]
MRRRIGVLSALLVLAYGCATTVPQPEKGPESLRGIASWYGEEFAGRTTANGEIFDPTLLTAAHRTLPFGTILEVTNPKTGRSVWVRVNDRGPYIANRIIDLSYAAAQKIGLVEAGVGDVDLKVVKLGSGEREAPAAFDVTIAEAPAVAPAPAPAAASTSTTTPEAPAVDFPLPAVVERVDVETQRGDVVTRKQVADDGRTIADVPTGEKRATATPAPAQAPSRPRSSSAQKEFIVQVGAFAVEENAKLLQERLTSIGQRAWVDHGALFRVRIGPFATRDLAVAARESLESHGLSAIIIAE